MRYYSFLIMLLCCVNISAQSSSYYIRSNGSVRVKKENEEKWTVCAASGMQQIELTDSVVADGNSEYVIIRQNGSVKSILHSELGEKRLMEDVVREEDSNSGNMIAASNRSVYGNAESGRSGSTYVTARMSMRGTLTDVRQVDSLVSTVMFMLNRNVITSASPVSAVIVSDNVKGDYIRLTNSGDKIYHINVLVREEDGTFNSLFSDITEESTTIGNATFPFIAVPAGGAVDLDMWRFFELSKLGLVLVSTEDAYSIVLFNALLAEESLVHFSQTMAERIYLSTVGN